MLWKILFYLYSTGLLYLSYTTVYNSHSDSGVFSCSEPMAFGICSVVILAFAFMLLLFGNAFKKQIISKKATLFTTGLSTIANILLPLTLTIMTLKDKSPSVSLFFAGIIVLVLVLVITTIIFLPIYFGLYTYYTKYNSYENFKYPILKVLALFSLFGLYIMSTCNDFNQAIKSYSSLNIIDYLNGIWNIYTIAFLVLFFINKKIFHELFWKITSIIYLPLTVIVLNDSYSRLKDLKELAQYPSPIILFIALLFLFLFKILYLYSFKENKTEKPQVQIV